MWASITRQDRGRAGFTIVELLIVIVVIGILAAITIVSYNGIQSRANKSSAASAAQSLAKKIEIYASVEGTYPTSTAQLTGATDDKAYKVTGITFLATAPTGAPAEPSTIALTKCDGSGGATGGDGNQIIYWDYVANNIAAITTGVVVACSYAP